MKVKKTNRPQGFWFRSPREKMKRAEYAAACYSASFRIAHFKCYCSTETPRSILGDCPTCMGTGVLPVPPWELNRDIIKKIHEESN